MSKGKYAEQWKLLLSDRRVIMPKTPDGEITLCSPKMKDKRTPFEADYERVVFSYSLRRLAGKTQVHPFADIDYIHNRLTHSIEVSSVSYTLALGVGKFLNEKQDVQKKDIESICWITQAAGLSHDIGNPPYGHSGESAIQQWAAKNKNSMGNQPYFNDFYKFDGNAQTFRLMSRDDLRESTFFRFTIASLGAVVKYPFSSDEAIEKPKFAAFSSEKRLFGKVWDELGLVRDGKRIRHPLSYLSEAADDICYRIRILRMLF